MYNKFKQSIPKVGLAVSGVLSMLVGFTTPSQATLIGQNVTVEFSGDNTNFGGATFSDVVMVGAGVELRYFDGSNIGDNVFLDNELIDIGDASIVYQVEGGGAQHPDDTAPPNDPQITTTGLDATAQYDFTNLVWGSTPGRITGVSVVLDNVVGVATGSEVFFTDNSVTLNVGTLGVGWNTTLQAFVGTITLNLQVEHDTTPPPQIPEPSSILLFGTGLAGLAWLAQRRRTA